jgi:hypothetical protein
MCGNILGGLLGGGDEKPEVVYQSPKADAAKAESEANAKAAQAKTVQRRRMRASSLLATGGDGDMTGIGTVGGKTTLGGS